VSFRMGPSLTSWHVVGIAREFFLSSAAAYIPQSFMDKLHPGKTAGYKRTQKRRSEEHTSELQSQSNLVCRLLLEKKKKISTYSLVPLDRFTARTPVMACLHSSAPSVVATTVTTSRVVIVTVYWQLLMTDDVCV